VIGTPINHLPDRLFKMCSSPDFLGLKGIASGVPLFISDARKDYKVSVESFAKLVKNYISRQPAGFRLNFFVDEAGQFIGQDSRLMLNLQTITAYLPDLSQWTDDFTRRQ